MFGPMFRPPADAVSPVPNSVLLVAGEANKDLKGNRVPANGSIMKPRKIFRRFILGSFRRLMIVVIASNESTRVTTGTRDVSLSRIAIGTITNKLRILDEVD